MIYGHGKTIHKTGYLDVEVHDGKVVAVWFRCLTLPFSVTTVDYSRAVAMSQPMALKRLVAVEVEYGPAAEKTAVPGAAAVVSETERQLLEARLEVLNLKAALAAPPSAPGQGHIYRHIVEGDWVRYTGEASSDQVAWGSNTDPRGVLAVGVAYQVASVELHTWHTKYHLVGVAGGFNSVHFVPIPRE